MIQKVHELFKQFEITKMHYKIIFEQNIQNK